MKITEIEAAKLLKGYSNGFSGYTCVDFLTKEYIDCDTITIKQLLSLLARPDTVKFYRTDNSVVSEN